MKILLAEDSRATAAFTRTNNEVALLAEHGVFDMARGKPFRVGGMATTIWLFTVFANLVLGGIVVFQVWQARLVLENEARTLTENYARTLEENVVGYLNKIDLTLLNVVDELHRQQRQGGIKPAEINAFLKRQDSYIPETYGLRISNAAGDIIHAVSFVKGTQVSIADRPQFIYLRDHPAADLFIGKPVVGRISLKTAFPMARRYNKSDGSFGGVIFVGVPVDYFIKTFSRLDLGRHGSSALWDAASLYARHDKSDAVMANASPSPQFKSLIDAEAAQAHYRERSTDDGLWRSLHVRKIEARKLFLLVGLAEKDYLAGWRKGATIIAALYALFLLASFLMSRQLCRNLKFRDAAQERLAAERDLLEQRVIERTADLQLAKEAAEAANIAKSAFLANMSHEMRTPLNHVSGLAAMIQREPLTTRQRERLEKLESASGSLTTMIDTILNLTRIEAGHFDLVEASVDPGEIVRAVVATLQPRADAKHLRLQVAVDELDATLLGDNQLIRQALSNYVDNAIRFTDSGTVRVSCILMAREPASAVIRFEVVDTGNGIAPDVLSRLFNIFEQADNSSTRQYGGLGVGLAMTRKIARAMGGEAGCESHPGAGSTFWFTVRLQRKT